MAIIYSYPTATPNMNTLLLGTAVDGETGLNVTKQFSVSAISNLIASVANGYRSYTAYLSMDGIDPVPTVLFDNINGSIAFERVSTGIYDCIISGVDNFDTAWYAITDNKFYLISSTENYIVIDKTSSSTLTIYTYKSNVLSDDCLDETPIEIKIFD